MREYYIYLIEEEFATHYFGRESLIYHLFLEYSQSKHERKEILNKQIEFITRSIPTLRIQQKIEASLAHYFYYNHQSHIHTIDWNEFNSFAKLTIHNEYIQLQSSGSYEAETAFFEILRKYDRCFLAMDFSANKYGWLTPIKERKLI
ncbi:sporulation inhibitor of replication protein SirA [Bacillus timonensis]|uniref:sporulation inhibitor of replication protein SirA n=1 Tax=Bacillus timonensis TaxID=1033734 RepID=UPI00028A0195|nr:sporulation inhibitor of replication protein SirA [Bacillus timonensis]